MAADRHVIDELDHGIYALLRPTSDLGNDVVGYAVVATFKRAEARELLEDLTAIFATTEEPTDAA